MGWDGWVKQGYADAEAQRATGLWVTEWIPPFIIK